LIDESPASSITLVIIERAQILAAVDEPGAALAEVARRENICTCLAYE
jgi:hypothetical protein